MTFEEALSAMKDGKKVTYGSKEYKFSLDVENGLICQEPVDEPKNFFRSKIVLVDLLLRNDWEIYHK